MKGLRQIKVLRIKITRTPNEFKLPQEHYVEKILRKFKQYNCKLVSTSYDLNSRIKRNKEYSRTQLEYAQMISNVFN